MESHELSLDISNVLGVSIALLEQAKKNKIENININSCFMF